MAVMATAAWMDQVGQSAVLEREGACKTVSQGTSAFANEVATVGVSAVASNNNKKEKEKQQTTKTCSDGGSRVTIVGRGRF